MSRALLTRGIWIALLVWALVLGLAAVVFGLPAGYYKYGRDCAREQQRVYGAAAWTSLMLAQIEVESAWRPLVCSPYACGLTQFTPATEAAVEAEAGLAGSVYDPEHACRLQAHLLKRLALQAGPVFEGFVPEWAATFRTYNGSPRSFWQEWVRAGRPTNTIAMEGTCVRRAAFCHENWSYPHKVFRAWRGYLVEARWPR